MLFVRHQDRPLSGEVKSTARCLEIRTFLWRLQDRHKWVPKPDQGPESTPERWSADQRCSVLDSETSSGSLESVPAGQLSGRTLQCQGDAQSFTNVRNAIIGASLRQGETRTSASLVPSTRDGSIGVYAVRAINRVPAGSCHFSCSTDPSQSVASFPCIRK